MSRRRDSRPTAEAPRSAERDPTWISVGIIAALGFVIGFAWPKLTDTRLAPRPPSLSAPAAAASAKPAKRPPPPGSASIATPPRAPTPPKRSP